MEKGNFSDIEKDLHSHLSSANLTKEGLAGISKSIAASYSAGLKIVDWWIYGIPAFERLVIQAQLPVGQVASVQGLLQNESIKGIDILRKGIPRPDYFQVELTINKQQ